MRNTFLVAEFLFGPPLLIISRNLQKHPADKMCHTKSPAKLLRDVKRMARFNENQKTTSNQILRKLSIITTSSIDIPPSKNHLEIVKLESISISPVKPRSLTFTTPILTDLPPDPLPCFYCDLVCPKPNLPDTPTSPYEVCYICQKPLSFFARELCNAVAPSSMKIAGVNISAIAFSRLWSMMVPVVLWSPRSNWPNWHRKHLVVSRLY